MQSGIIDLRISLRKFDEIVKDSWTFRIFLEILRIVNMETFFYPFIKFTYSVNIYRYLYN